MYLTRPKQAEYIREKFALPMKRQRLDDLASKGGGPREVVINGRYVSTAEWLDEWIAAQAARPVRRRRERDADLPAL